MNKEGEVVGSFLFACNSDEEDASVNMKVLSPGTFTANDLWFGYYILMKEGQGESGWGNIFTTVSGTRTE